MAPAIAPLRHTGPRNGELPAYVSNGVVGLRVREVPLFSGMAAVSGVAGEHPELRMEAAASAPYPLAGDLALDGVWLSDQPWAISNLQQSYDFATGELTSSFRFDAGEVGADVEVLTFASRTAATLVLQETKVTPDKACDLSLRAIVDTARIRGRLAERRTQTPGEDPPACDGSVLWQTEGAVSECGIAYATELGGLNADRDISVWDLSGPLVTEYCGRARAGRAVMMRQIAALVPSVVHHRPHEEAVRRVARGGKTGFDTLRARNRDAWANLWESRIVVHGASERHQALIDAAFFYLNASVHQASPSATSIFGLATWHDYHYYYGHVMWDIDAFCVPPLIFTQPAAARAILHFRTRGREAARANARLSGRDGLQFPWEAAPTSGEEATSGSGGGAAHEDHISLHTARAFSLYADVTGDRSFLEEDAWPILSGVADWIVSRTVRTERGVEFPGTMGPAEVPEPPDNDAFTIMAAYDVLKRAIRAAELLGKPIPAAWSGTLPDFYLPFRADGALATHDGFRIDESKGATPSPLAGLFPFEHPLSQEQRDSTLELFLGRWQDYVGSPMLPALYSVWATIAGDPDLALELFEQGYAAYDCPRFHQCLEYRPDHPDSKVRAGPFFANLGGMLLGMLFGFTGLRPDDGDPKGWPCRPILLPQGWTSIEVDRVWIRGTKARLVARNGAEGAELHFH
jgi:trehalose/maltose hydrolase-like predicted phosphorylase